VDYIEVHHADNDLPAEQHLGRPGEWSITALIRLIDDAIDVVGEQLARSGNLEWRGELDGDRPGRGVRPVAGRRAPAPRDPTVELLSSVDPGRDLELP
jgi:phytoene/squalene synthetase